MIHINTCHESIIGVHGYSIGTVFTDLSFSWFLTLTEHMLLPPMCACIAGAGRYALGTLALHWLVLISCSRVSVGFATTNA